MLKQSEKEVADFQQEGATELAQSQARAEKDGLVIDDVDKEELKGLNNEANVAKEELVAEIGNEQVAPEENVTIEKMQQPDSVENIKSKRDCPKCGREGNENSNFCEECGGKMETQQVRVCLGCGKETKMGNKFCEDCGNGFEKKQREDDAQFSSMPPTLPNTPPPLPDMPPPLPEMPKSAEEDKKDNSAMEEQIESELVGYLKESKIADKTEAMKRLKEFVMKSSEHDFKNKLKDSLTTINMSSPDSIGDIDIEDIDAEAEVLREVKSVGDALGYNYINTPGYEYSVVVLMDKLRSKGKKTEASKVEDIFKDLKVEFEKEKDKSQFQKIDDELFETLMDEEKLRKYTEEQKNLPPDATVYLYHGLNEAGYDGAIQVLDGKSKGIEQRSGPTLSMLPLGQFWKGVGFRYALRRDQIEFPGENNPNAVVQMKLGDDGIPDTGYIVNESGNLPLDQFEADVMRSKFTLPDPDTESKLAEKLRSFAEARNKDKQV